MGLREKGADVWHCRLSSRPLNTLTIFSRWGGLLVESSLDLAPQVPAQGPECIHAVLELVLDRLANRRPLVLLERGKGWRRGRSQSALARGRPASHHQRHLGPGMGRELAREAARRIAGRPLLPGPRSVPRLDRQRLRGRRAYERSAPRPQDALGGLQRHVPGGSE